MSEAKVRVRVAHNAMHLPVVALRGLVVFPNNVVHFEVGRQIAGLGCQWQIPAG